MTDALRVDRVGAEETAPTPVDTSDTFAARTRGLRKTYGSTVAVADVDLAVPHGAVVGVLGPNGSGKTTTIRMLLGLTRPTSGEVELLGCEVPEHADRVLPRVGALVEGPGFHPFLSGRQNLLRCAAMEPHLTRSTIPGAVGDALDRVGLSRAADRRFRGYSLGMKQRLGLAAALLVPRELVVLDEPTNGLDPAGTKEVRRIIAELHGAGTTVLVSSHLLSEVEATCTHVAVMHQGSLVAQGELAGLLESGGPTLLVSTPDVDGGVEALRDNRIAASEHQGEIRVELTDVDAPEVIAELVRAGIGVHEARRGRTGLEDVFARLTEDES
ncbi:ATP-binding cassette domain-containing protein [Allosaccharopolyspora coralli]|uniref:ATP-binding cassette domain-containing protein n=1 Tax=Allosaccharopolyspora coralli TaxID=2665642 RepID=A0A5Q3QB63_9PSEU|nr:ABC transporter ATP-binding protein [Allosaccharopolyspora coralli]QGK68849.1 ATP-binding cassette domain-containing protein [Allosaccharopolyspora coralli]